MKRLLGRVWLWIWRKWTGDKFEAAVMVRHWRAMGGRPDFYEWGIDGGGKKMRVIYFPNGSVVFMSGEENVKGFEWVSGGEERWG